MKDEDYIIFQNYLSKSLSSEEILDFEHRLKTDLEFKTGFETYKELETYLDHNFGDNNSKAFEENLKSISDTYFEKEEQKRESKSKVTYFKIGKLAIAATVIIFFGLFIFKNNSQPSYGDFSDHEQISLSVRGESGNTLKEAEKAFNSKKYVEAEAYFSEILETSPNNIEIQLYKAISQIEQNKFDLADSSLRAIIKDGSVYKNDALWYAALSKLKQKKFAASVTLLKLLPNDAMYYKKAQKLIDKLD